MRGDERGDDVSTRRLQTWLAVIVIGIGLLFLGIAGLFVYMSNTAVPLHSRQEDVPTSVQAPPTSEWAAHVEHARRVVRAGIVDQNLPGVSIAVGIGRDLVWVEGFGWADIAQRVPVQPDTRFRIGTASVALTAAAAGLLLEQDRLNLDAPIRTYVPEFPEKPWPVTLRQVMGHTAGITNDGGDEGPLYGRHCDRPIDGIDAFADRDLRFEPGTQFRYSSFGWILVSAAIEAAAGEPFLSFMRRQIFEPLGMHDTLADSLTAPVAGAATPYFPRFAADPRYGPDVMRPVDYSCYAGASAFLSTPSDLVRFGFAMLHGTVLRPETVTRLQTSQRLASGEETGYGLGWDIETVDLVGAPTRWVGHDGTSLGGTVASLIMFPERGLVIAVLSNTSYADTESLAVSVARVFTSR